MSAPDGPPNELRIAVYCGSRFGTSTRYRQAAEAVGRELLHHGAGLVYGGGRVGLMGVVADTVLAGGGEVVGVIPTHLMSEEMAHRGVTELLEVPDMATRKGEMFRRADAFITMPGGVGSMEEFFEVLTWKYLRLHPKPMGILNTDGFYDPLITMLRHMLNEGFMAPEVLDLVVVDEDPARLVTRIARDAAHVSPQGATPPHPIR